MLLKNTSLYKYIIQIYLKILVLVNNSITKLSVFIFESFKESNFVRLFTIKLLKRHNLQIMHILTHKLYTDNNNLVYHCIKSDRIGISPEIVYNIDDAPVIHHVKIPDLFYTILKNISIYSNCDSVCDFNQSILINDFDYNINPTFSALSQIVYGTYKNHALVKISNSVDTIECGIMIVADFSNNYYHLLHEVLAKLYLIQKHNISNDIPLLVDECICRIPQFKEAFDCIYDGKKKIIWISENCYTNVNTLYYFSPINLFPGHTKNTKNVDFLNYGFDISILSEIRKVYFKHILTDSDTVLSKKRLFISRKGHNRRNYNEDELYLVAQRYGFVKIFPEKLSFAEQISFFNNADIILGASGAAFSNIIFCNEKTFSICLFSMRVNIPTFTICSYLSNSKLVYLIGKKVKSNATRSSIHSDFNIDPKDLDDLLSKICCLS